MVTSCAPRETLSGGFRALHSTDSPSLIQIYKLQPLGAALQTFHSPTNTAKIPCHVCHCTRCFQKPKAEVRDQTHNLAQQLFPLGVMVIGGGAPPKIHLPYEESSPHGRQDIGTRARNTTGSWESGEMQRSWESEAPTVMEEMAWTSQGLHGDWQTGVPPWIPGPSIQGQGKAGHEKQ